MNNELNGAATPLTGGGSETETSYTESSSAKAGGGGGTEPNRSSRPLQSSADRTQGHALLRQALEALTDGERPVPAAAVSLEMKRISGSFTPRDYGFTSFRRFLEHAQAHGVVSLTRSASDILVGRPGALAAASSHWIPPQIWKGVLTGEPSTILRSTGEAINTPLMSSENSDEVRLPVLSAATLQEWLQQFLSDNALEAISADQLQDYADLRDRVYQLPRRQQRLWARHLRAHVTDLLISWATHNDLPTTTVFHDSLNIQTATLSNTNRTDDSGSASERLTAAVENMQTSELRRLVIAAVEGMSRSALMNIPIPLDALRR